MPEIKNTFLKSKMNKDLDARIVPNGEYRDAINVSVSTSEGSDVGALENIRGNFDLTNFGLTDLNLEIIGSVIDPAKNRIYFFITNFVDASATQLENMSATDGSESSSIGLFSRSGAANYIAYCEIPYLLDQNLNSANIISEVLVQGAFLNFSKTQPISGINILEDFLFWTDNRNQPRKINVETAVGSPLTYYTHEDHISVAKYAPFKPIGFLNTTVNPHVNTLKNEIDEWLPATFISPGIIGQTVVSPTVSDIIIFSNANFGSGGGAAPYASPATHFGTSSLPNVRVYKIQDENRNYAYIDTIASDPATDQVTLKNESGTQIIDIETILGWGAIGDTGTFGFEVENPNYNQNFAGDKDLLKEKFVKFSYRFKYEDDEYSLVAPFSQTAFIPKQYGYFIGNDDEKAKKSSIVDFMENQVTTVGLVIDLPYAPNNIKERLKLKEIQLLYKASDEQTLKVVADIQIPDIRGIVDDPLIILYAGTGFTSPSVNKSTIGGSGSGLTVDTTVSGGQITSVTVNNPGNGYRIGDVIEISNPTDPRNAQLEITSLNSTFIFEYKSQKPIKVLDDQEIIRVNDIVPLRAKTQEIVGNRVVYGNFLQNNTTPVSLNYEVTRTNKGTYNASNNKEFLNNTLKQGRTYQIGLVLQDRYGRASNVIINNNANSISLNSTFFAPYTNGGTDPLNWSGNSIRVLFNEEIPTQKTSTYNGIWQDENNPLGWYTYKVVVKQQDQDYYNVYVPGCLSGTIEFEKLDKLLTYTDTEEVTHIALTNDNVNKVSRDLKQVGPTDDYYSSSMVLYSRVKNSKLGSDYSAPDVNEQNLTTKQIEVTSVKAFRDLGRWASMKNTNVVYVDATGTDDDGFVVGPYAPDPPEASPTPIYIYPGAAGNMDPFYLKDNKNPFIATLSTNSRLGYTSTNQESDNFKFAKKLMVFETKPFKSNIDIYYESSSTGLVSDFNTSVGYGSGPNGQPYDLSTFVPSFKENINYPTDVSNVFQVVDINGNIITDNSPSIILRSVEQNIPGPNGYSYTPINSPFNLITIQQPSFGIPPTYKLETNKYFIYLANSNTEDKYKLNFLLRANGMNDVVVTKNVSLTNVKPTIYKMTTSYDDSQNGNYYENLFLKNWNNVDTFLDSSTSNYISNAYYDLSPQPIQDYITESNATVASVNPNSWEGLANFSHTTNGSEILATFDSSNDAKNLTSPSKRFLGLVPVIVKADRYDAQANSPASNKRYCKKDGSTDVPVDSINNFKITTVMASGGAFYYRLDYNNPGISRNNLPQLPSYYVGSDVGAWFYYLEIKLVDASDNVGKLSSNTYNINVLVKPSI